MRISQKMAAMIWVMLSSEVRGPESDPYGFADYVSRNESGEFRLFGKFVGFGGKFYWTKDQWRVNCYEEDTIVSNSFHLIKINQRLADMRSAYQVGIEDGEAARAAGGKP